MKKSILHIAILISLFLSVSSCGILKSRKIQKQGTLDQKEFMMEIPFEYINNLIIVEATINKKQYNFIFDTGAPWAVIDTKFKDEINPKIRFSSKVGDSSSKSKMMQFFNLPPLKIGDLEIKELGALSADLSGFGDLAGCDKTIHGLLGNNLFRKAKWKIDYQNKTIQFTDDISNLKVDKNAIAIAMKCGKRGNGYIPLEFNGIKKNFTFDTGCNSKINANIKLFDELKAAGKNLEYVEKEGLIISLHGKNAVKFYTPIIDKIEMGNQTFENIIPSFRKNSSNLIGNVFWENFIVTTDWSNCTVYLSPVEEMQPDTIKAFEYGFAPNYSTSSLNIVSKSLSHPTRFEGAMNAKVLKIDGVDLTKLDEDGFCDFIAQDLKTITKKEKLDLLILADEKEKTIQLHRAQLLPKGN